MRLFKNGDEQNELAYWFCANAILHWFDLNLKSAQNYKQFKQPRRNGVQNNVKYTVAKDEYFKLINDCQQALEHKGNADKVPECLQPRCGIKFGSKAYNDYYWDDLEETIEMLTESASKIDWNKDTITFQIQY